MKKVTAIVLGIIMAGATSRAWALFDASVFGGYTTVGMSDVNAQLDKYSSVNDVTKFGAGYYIGVDASLPLLMVLNVGPRVEYISAFQAKTAPKDGGQATTDDASLIPLMLGVNYILGIPMSDLSFKAGIWGGWGLAGAKNSGPIGDILMDGSGFVGEAMVGARYKLMPLVALGLDLGYRMAKITNMEYSADFGNGSIKKGDAVKDSDNNNLAYDFSGMNVGLSLNIGF